MPARAYQKEKHKMIGYIFHSIGFGWGDLLLFVFSLLAGMWVVRSWRRGTRSRALKLVTIPVALLALIPFLMLGLAFLAAKSNSPAAITVQSTRGLQEMAMNMGSSINTRFRDTEPTFTADGRTMYFNCYNADICVSHLIGSWEKREWTPPERLEAPISTGYFEVEPLINATGEKLYFQSNRPAGHLKGNPLISPFVTSTFYIINRSAETKLDVDLLDGLGLGDVWVSYKVNGSWSEPKNLSDVPGEPPVNTVFHDHCLSFSGDGNQAFWTSTRPGGFGGNDIWTSRRVEGKWTPPENLGPKVNSPADEHHSILTPNGKSLYVTTTRAVGYGGEDNYITTRAAGGKWGSLVNLGPVVNGPGIDRCPVWTPDFKIFLFDSTREAGFGGRDIWWVYFKEVQGYPLFKASSNVRVSKP
jgi:hypothetical protein